MSSLLMIKQDNNVIMFLKMYKIRVNVYNKKHKIRVEEKTKTIITEKSPTQLTVSIRCVLMHFICC